MEPTNGYDFYKIFDYGIQMTVTLVIVLLVNTLRVYVSSAETKTWYQTNALRVFIGFISTWAISAGIVVVPGIAIVLGGLGFNADQGTASIALVIGGFLIGSGDAAVATPPDPGGEV